MNIQKQTSLNFQATKVLTATKTLNPKSLPDIVDVFKLDRQTDDIFIRMCYDVMRDKKLSMKELFLKKIFKSFLEEKKHSNKDYFLAIDQDNRIVGALYADNEDKIKVNRAVCTKNKQIIKDSLAMTLLNTAEQTNKKRIFGSYLDWALNMKAVIENRNFSKTKNLIRKNNPDSKFEVSDNTKYDLEEFLGLK